MTTALTDPRAQVPQQLAEKLLLGGDLSPLTPQERLTYYNAVCTSLGLNPLTRPFEYLVLGQGEEKKMVLYARKDCTDQLRDLHGISVEIASREMIEGVIVVTARAKNMTERMDESIGAVPVVTEIGEWKTATSGKRYFQGDGTYKPLTPLERANAFMKAETKAKRRVTLSICGLGVMDETELDGTDAKKLYHAEDGTEAEKTPAQIQSLLHETRQQLEQQPAQGDVKHDRSLTEFIGAAPDLVAPASQDAPAIIDPSEAHRVKLRVCERTSQAITHTFNAIPEELRQDVFGEYQAQLKSLTKKK